MISSCVLVGRIVSRPVVNLKEEDRFHANILIETERPYRQREGILEKDIFEVEVWRGIAEEIACSYREGAVIAMRGHMQSEPYTGENGETKYRIKIIAERIVFRNDMQDASLKDKVYA